MCEPSGSFDEYRVSPLISSLLVNEIRCGTAHLFSSPRCRLRSSLCRISCENHFQFELTIRRVLNFNVFNVLRLGIIDILVVSGALFSIACLSSS